MAGEEKHPDGRRAMMQEWAKAYAEAGRHFFYVRIPEALGPIERGDKYEEPLQNALGELGEVTGGGSQMGDGHSIAYCGIDLVVNDRDRGLRIIRQSMRACGAPAETVIEEYVPTYRELEL